VVRTIGREAAWRVEVTGEVTRITVLRGEVSVESAWLGGGPPQTLKAGEHVEVKAIRQPAPQAAAPIDTSVSALFHPASSSLPSASPSAPLELDPSPRPLVDLVGSADDDVAFVAASALVGSSSSPRDRAAIWRRYLGHDRPSPHADVAMADLANVLLDMKNAVEARVVVEALAARPPAPEAAEALDRARGRLLSHAATECLAHDLRAVCPEKADRNRAVR
jgi:hypothetical protein